MKVVLNESQFCHLLLNESCNLINNDKLLDIIKRKIKHLLLAGVATASIIAAIDKLNIEDSIKEKLSNFIEQQEDTTPKRTPEEQLAYERKVRACEAYMLTALSNQNFKPESTQLTPEALVDSAEKYNFDLPFLMAAAHLESCFGATPRARRTNSVFSVGSYDNGKDVVTYSHPNESISGYIELLLSDYLINGKTLNDLMTPGKFVNKNGHRFASNKKYERQLRQIRNRIIKNYPDLA